MGWINEKKNSFSCDTATLMPDGGHILGPAQVDLKDWLREVISLLNT